MFKVGDKVKIAETCERKYLHGKTGVIEYVDNDDPECTYGANIGGVAMWFCNADLEPYNTPPTIQV